MLYFTDGRKHRVTLGPRPPVPQAPGVPTPRPCPSQAPDSQSLLRPGVLAPLPPSPRFRPPWGPWLLPLREEVVAQPAIWHWSPGCVQRKGRRRGRTRGPGTTGLPSFSSMRSCSSVRLGRMGPEPCWYLGWTIGREVRRSCSPCSSSRWSSPTRAHRGLGREEPSSGLGLSPESLGRRVQALGSGWTLESWQGKGLGA